MRRILQLGYPPSGRYRRPIYSIPSIISTQCIPQDRDLPFILYPTPPARYILRGGYLLSEYETSLSNWKPLGSNRAEYPIRRHYRLASGPIPAPPGGFPIHMVSRQLDDDRI